MTLVTEPQLESFDLDDSTPFFFSFGFKHFLFCLDSGDSGVAWKWHNILELVKGSYPLNLGDSLGFNLTLPGCHFPPFPLSLSILFSLFILIPLPFAMA